MNSATKRVWGGRGVSGLGSRGLGFRDFRSGAIESLGFTLPKLNDFTVAWQKSDTLKPYTLKSLDAAHG